MGVGGALWQLFSIALTFHCVAAAWCFFRLTDFTDSLRCLGKCVAFDGERLFVGDGADVSLWLLLGVYGVAVMLRDLWQRRPAWAEVWARPAAVPLARGALWGFGVALLLLSLLLSPGGEAPPFIYFQF